MCSQYWLPTRSTSVACLVFQTCYQSMSREEVTWTESPGGAVPHGIQVPIWAHFAGRSSNVRLICNTACFPVTAVWWTQGDSWVLPDLRADVGRRGGNRGLLSWYQDPLHPRHSTSTKTLTSYWWEAPHSWFLPNKKMLCNFPLYLVVQQSGNSIHLV